MVACPSPARAQAFVELGGGWNYVTPAAATPHGDTYGHGLNARVSVGRELAPNFRMRIDVLGIQFDHNVQYYPPCPAPGCTRSYYDVQSNSVVGVTVNGLLNVDPRGILYIVGGPGVYDAFVPSAELHLGVSVGAGVAVPIRAGLRAFAEARWHHLFGGAAAPSQFLPITVGLRY